MDFLHSDDDEGPEGQPQLNSFSINKDFAARFEHNEKRKEREQLEEKYGKQTLLDGGDEDESEEEDSEEDEIEDEVGELITPAVDAQILKTIVMLQTKDKKVYDPEAHFFKEEDLDLAQKLWEAKKALPVEKPILLKDYHRSQLLGGGEKKETTTFLPTFAEEQEDIRSAFKQAAASKGKGEDEDKDDLFTVRKISTEGEETEGLTLDEKESYSQFLISQIDEKNQQEKWVNARNKPETLEDEDDEAVDGLAPQKGRSGKDKKKDDEFLMKFVLNRGWIDPDKDHIPTFNEITMEHDLTDDEDEERMDDFETKYNFRFEESGSAQVITHARDVPGVVRRKDNSRTLKRQAEQEKKEAQRTKRQEELKRLKNLKMKELSEKLEKIKEMAGGDLIGLSELDLAKDFDPTDYDQTMNQAFADDQYYSNLEKSKSGKLKKPKWDDDIDISDLIPEASEDQVSKKRKGKAAVAFNYDAYNQEEGETGPEELKSQMEKYMEEYYQLDYEDLIGDLPVRFKYRKVEKEDFSLKVEEILKAKDADLNDVISLKKLGPYRAGSTKEKDDQKWKLTKKKKLWEFRAKLKGKDVTSESPEMTAADERASKRIRKEAKINESRLSAYTALSSTSTSKSKKTSHKAAGSSRKFN